MLTPVKIVGDDDTKVFGGLNLFQYLILKSKVGWQIPPPPPPRYFPVEFAGIFRPGKYAQSGKYGKYDFGLVIM